MQKPHITLIGLGLIGSSLGLALKQGGLAAHISGFARTNETRARAAELGFVDTVYESAEEAVQKADIVFINTPISAMGRVAQAIAPHMRAGAIVTDTGSVKQAVIELIQPALPVGVHFVPAHPVAGTEHSGPDAGFADLFKDRWCILTPTQKTDSSAIDTIKTLWRALGSQVELMDAAHHDLALAVTSHLPHLIAYNMVHTAAARERVLQDEVVKFSAGGFRDFTRIAASNPIMWRDVFLYNQKAILDILARFTDDLAALRAMIESQNGEELEVLFSRTRSIRHAIIDAGQEITAPDFGRRKAAQNKTDKD